MKLFNLFIQAFFTTMFICFLAVLLYFILLKTVEFFLFGTAVLWLKLIVGSAIVSLTAASYIVLDTLD